MEGSAFRLEEICRRRGLKIRGRRLIVLSVLDEARDYPTLTEIYRHSGFRNRRVGFITTRRTVADLVSVGLIAVLDTGDGEPRYCKIPEGQIGQLIDVERGAILKFSSSDLDRAIEEILQSLGYELHSYRVWLTGRRKSH